MANPRSYVHIIHLQGRLQIFYLEASTFEVAGGLHLLEIGKFPKQKRDLGAGQIKKCSLHSLV